MHGGNVHKSNAILELMPTAYWLMYIELSLPIIVLANVMQQTEFPREQVHSLISAVQLDGIHDRTEQLGLLLAHEVLDQELAARRILNLLTCTEAGGFVDNTRSGLQGTGAHCMLDTKALSMGEMRRTISCMAW
jgi:hypothetical protein